MAAELRGMMQVAKAVAASPEDPNLGKLLLGSAKSVAEALARLAEASKGVIREQLAEKNVNIYSVASEFSLY